jgi:hypothetical protein
VFYSLVLYDGEAYNYQERMKHKSVLVFLIIVTMIFSVQHTYASVPKGYSWAMQRPDNDVIIRITIEHSDWSESHYVDIVEVTMDGKSLNITNLEPQTTYKFSVNGTYNNTEMGDFQFRAHCVTHGWSQWEKQYIRTIVGVPINDSKKTAARIGSYAHLDIDKLHRRADMVVKGTVTDVSTSEDVRHYYLTAIIDVEKYLKNPSESHIAPALRITVQSSELKMSEEFWYETPALVYFSVGEKVIVYLENTDTEVCSPVGASQGKFTLVGNSYVNSGGEVIREPNPFSSWIVGLVIFGALALVIVIVWRARADWVKT